MSLKSIRKMSRLLTTANGHELGTELAEVDVGETVEAPPIPGLSPNCPLHCASHRSDLGWFTFSPLCRYPKCNPAVFNKQHWSLTWSLFFTIQLRLINNMNLWENIGYNLKYLDFWNKIANMKISVLCLLCTRVNSGRDARLFPRSSTGMATF